jgi:hypothetical protein
VFPTTSVRGVWLQYSNACFLKFFEMGLLELYHSDDRVDRILYKIIVLPILPANKICGQVDLLFTNLAQQVEHEDALALLTTFFMEYLIPFWIEKIGPSRLSVFGCQEKFDTGFLVFHSRMHFIFERKNEKFDSLDYIRILQGSLFNDIAKKIDRPDKRMNIFGQLHKDPQE